MEKKIHITSPNWDNAVVSCRKKFSY